MKAIVKLKKNMNELHYSRGFGRKLILRILKDTLKTNTEKKSTNKNRENEFSLRKVVK